MRILQVVTLIDDEGSFGGPVRVAMNQAAALRTIGHDVTVVAASRGPRFGRDSGSQIPTFLFRARRPTRHGGFAPLSAPSMLWWIWKNRRNFDIAHVHLARDLVTLPAAFLLRLLRIPYVLQTHGMVQTSTAVLAIPLDQLLTKPILRTAKAVMFLTTHEAENLKSVEANINRLRPLTNGVPVSEIVPDPDRPLEALFLARLQERKKPVVFAQAATNLSNKVPQWEFSIAGPDEGQAPALSTFAPPHGPVNLEGAVDPAGVLQRLSKSSLYVLPSINEPFPMTVLEAMSLGIPVIITDTCGLARWVRQYECGIVTDGTLGGLERAMDILTCDAGMRATMGARGLRLVRDTFSMSAVAAGLQEIYLQATA